MIRGPEPGDGATVVAGPSVCLFLSGSIGGNLTNEQDRDTEQEQIGNPEVHREIFVQQEQEHEAVSSDVRQPCASCCLPLFAQEHQSV